MTPSPYTVARVTHVACENKAGVTVWLDRPLVAEPGQFVMVWLPHVDERPFAVMNDQPLALTVAAVGPFTEALCGLQPGARLWLRGPYGTAFPGPTGPLLLIGGGSGTASLALLAKNTIALGHQITAVVGARSDDGLMLVDHLAGLGAQVHIATDDGSGGTQGTVIDVLQMLPPFLNETCVCACGPEPMLSAVCAWAVRSHLACWVSMERLMKCGFGVCGACHAGDRLVCRDGPVFALREYERMQALEIPVVTGETQ